MPSILSRGIIDYNTNGQLFDDLFFRVFSGPFFDAAVDNLPGVLIKKVEGNDPTEVSIESEVVSNDSSGRCVFHPERKDISQIKFVHCMIANFGTNDGDVFGHNSFEYLHVSKTLQSALSRANFNGLRFSHNKIELDSPGPNYLKEIRTLCFDGRDIRRALIVRPESENYCRKCSYRPIVCPNCPTTMMFCPNCGEATGGVDYFLGEADESMLHFAADPGEGRGPVLDFHSWDGCDFIGPSLTECIVTGRVVDLLLKLDTKNVGFQPLRCFVKDGTTGYSYLKSHLYPQSLLQNPSNAT